MLVDSTAHPEPVEGWAVPHGPCPLTLSLSKGGRGCLTAAVILNGVERSEESKISVRKTAPHPVHVPGFFASGSE